MSTKIENIDRLIGEQVRVALLEGGEAAGVLTGVAHLDDWDVLHVGGREVRSTRVTRIYVDDRVFWPADAADELPPQAGAETGTAGFSPELYARAVSLVDRIVKAVLRDGTEVVGELQAVTPPAAGSPLLHVLPPEAEQVQLVRLADTVELVQYAITHEEMNGIVEQVGVESDEDTGPVEEQRRQAGRIRRTPDDDGLRDEISEPEGGGRGSIEAEVARAFGVSEEGAEDDEEPVSVPGYEGEVTVIEEAPETEGEEEQERTSGTESPAPGPGESYGELHEES